MQELATSRLSTRGQVVIPQEIRKKLKLRAGARFVVTEKGDSVIFTTLKQPTMEDFDEIMAEARRQARQAGLKKSDIAKAIAAARARR
jgi:AbrB family looped-hinge helix DNA binding protein